MNDNTSPGTYPFPEGIPDKPARIACDLVASAEWDRVCGLLSARRALSPAFGRIIEMTAASLSNLVRRMDAMEELDRTEEWAALLAMTLDNYRVAVTECGVAPDPRATLRGVGSGPSHLEDVCEDDCPNRSI